MPPARWRDWYPHKIDKWRGSLIVQGMSDGAYRGYHNLLMSQWQSQDGMLPKSEKELARLSGLFGRWAEFRDEILESFQNSGGRLVNQVQFVEWIRAKEVSEKKGRKNPDSVLNVEDEFQSEDAHRTHARVNVNVSVPVEQTKEVTAESFGENETLFTEPIAQAKPLTEQCEEIYQAYPRHTAKDPAIKAISKVLKKEKFEDLLAIVKIYASQIKTQLADGKIEKRYIPHPASWFNQGRYGDEDLKPPPEYEIKEVTAEEWWAQTNGPE